MRAERTVLSAGRRRVDRANIAVHRRPGIHCPKRAADRCGIAAARSDQQIAVSQPKHKAVARTVAIKVSPEHDIPCRVDCLQDCARMPGQGIALTTVFGTVGTAKIVE